MKSLHSLSRLFLILCLPIPAMADDYTLQRVLYNNEGLVVDLGVGLWAWPLPMDFDEDGDLDLVVVCPDKPFNGTWFFENPDGPVAQPVFLPPVRISKGDHNVQISYVDGSPRILSPGFEHTEFRTRGIETGVVLPISDEEVFTAAGRVRARQWKYVDYNGDGLQDIVAGYGDWTDYGWDDAFDKHGNWTRGPLRGYVFLLLNVGTVDEPRYAKAEHVMAGGVPVEVFGWPTPNFADFDGDGDLDLLCGEFIDRFNYFRNVGTRKTPVYEPARFLENNDRLIKMDLQMIVPVAIDWDGDGDVDLICGDEDGRVAFIENTGRLDPYGAPLFEHPVYFRQLAHKVKFGALATPFTADWDSDGDEDIVSGNTAGHIGYFENLGGYPPKFAEVQLLEADGEVIRILAGYNGSIQGPAEAKWGYTTLNVADWDHDGLLDIVINSIFGRVQWYRNIGEPGKPRLEGARSIEVAWDGPVPKPEWNWWDPVGNELVTQWRTTPCVVDWDEDGLNDLVMLDHEGYLAFFRRSKEAGVLKLAPGERIFVDTDGATLRPNERRAGGSGRRKLVIVDWDGDGRRDILFNSMNATLWRNAGERDGRIMLEEIGPLDSRPISGHSSSPDVVDWNADGIPDLLVGAEDGYFYYMQNPRRQ
jgi:hypothetical protein